MDAKGMELVDAKEIELVGAEEMQRVEAQEVPARDSGGAVCARFSTGASGLQ